MKTNLLKQIGLFSMLLALSTNFSSCGSSNKEEGTVTSSSNELQFAELLERDEALSKDEYIKIKAKYDNIKNRYAKDKSDAKNILKLVEIYIYEARVTGEHPHYYSAALRTLNWMLDGNVTLNKDDLFTTLFYKATVQLAQHNFTDALKTGEDALAINNVNSGIYGVLVDANVELGRYEKAVEMVDKMVQIRPDLRSYSRQSYLREIYGDNNGSKAAMVQAVKNGDPYSEYTCWALKTLGEIYESEGKLDSAAVCYEETMQRRPNYPFGIAGLARIEAKKGNTEKAYEMYNEAIAILPEIGFNIELAQLKKENGKEDEANKMVGEIETMFTEDIESGHNMNLEYAAFLADFKKEYDKALELANKELETRQKNIDVNKQLAFIYFEKGNMEKAKEHVEIALATNKKDADLICLKGVLEKDQAMIKKSFEHNKYQDHAAVSEAEKMLAS